MSNVMTVLGEVYPEHLGVTDAHNHVWIDQIHGVNPAGPVLNLWEPILSELLEYALAGGQTILDCQPCGCGRNANKLAKLSKASGVAIVACTGFHRNLYYPPDYWLWREQTEAIAHHFLQEIQTGMQETLGSEIPIRAGFIKIACEDTLRKTYQPALEAAVQAAVETRLAIEIHTEKGGDAEAIVEFFLNRNVKASQIILCHIDKRPDFSLHSTLAQTGIFLEYDTFYRPKYQPEKFLWPLITSMIAAGFEERITLATDMAEASMWSTLGGGPGLANYPQRISKQLNEIGLDRRNVKKLMGENISRCLAQL